MKIVIAGANGFVGKNFVEKLSDKSYEVVALSRSICDLSSSTELKNICSEIKPDLLIHSAVSLTNTDNNLSMYFALENASRYFGKCVMIGSGAEYSHQRYKPLMKEEYYDPSCPPDNQNPYHMSKFTISRLHSFSSCQNIFNFRVFGLYGLYEDYKRRLISNNIYNYITTGTMSYNKDISFDYLYVDDLLNAILHFNDQINPKHRTYNVCSGQSTKFSSILSDCIVALGGSTDQIICQDPSLSSYDYSGSCSRFETEFNYKISRTSFSNATLKLTPWLEKLVSSKI